MTVGIVDAGVGAVLGFVDGVGVDAEEGVWEPGVGEGGRVGEEDWDEEAAEGEEDAEAEGAEAVIDFVGGDDAGEGQVSECARTWCHTS